MSFSSGDMTVAVPRHKRTLCCASQTVTLAANPTYVFKIVGIGSFLPIRILRIGLNIFQGTGAIVDMQLNLLSTDLTGGTSSSASIIKYDSTLSSASASPKTYTANPTGGGALVGIIRAVKLTVPAATPTGTTQGDYVFDFTNNYAQELTLKSSSEIIGLTFLGTTFTSAIMCLWAEWTEETP